MERESIPFSRTYAWLQFKLFTFDMVFNFIIIRSYQDLVLLEIDVSYENEMFNWNGDSNVPTANNLKSSKIVYFNEIVKIMKVYFSDEIVRINSYYFVD